MNIGKCIDGPSTDITALATVDRIIEVLGIPATSPAAHMIGCRVRNIIAGGMEAVLVNHRRHLRERYY